MMNDLNSAKKMLLSGGYTCVLCHEDNTHTTTLRGVKPLVIWYESKLDFNGYCAADKVVGKATAFLYILLGVKAVYAGVISRSALQVLSTHKIMTQYGELVDNIINRQGDGICPFESSVLHIEDPIAAYNAIRKKMKDMDIRI